MTPSSFGCRIWALLAACVMVASACGDNGDSVTEGSIVTTTSLQPTTGPTAASTTTALSGDLTTVTATTVPPDATSMTVGTTTLPAPAGELVLVGDGLGAVSFSEPADSALPLLIDAIGRQPTSDSTISGDRPDGLGGADTTVRLVRFDDLSVTFTDWPYFRDDRVMHFVRWILFDFEGAAANGLATPEGITLGSTVDDLRAAFGDGVRFSDQLDECAGAWTFSVGPVERELRGLLDGPPTDSRSSVTFLSAGAQSSC